MTDEHKDPVVARLDRIIELLERIADKVAPVEFQTTTEYRIAYIDPNQTIWEFFLDDNLGIDRDKPARYGVKKKGHQIGVYDINTGEWIRWMTHKQYTDYRRALGLP